MAVTVTAAELQAKIDADEIVFQMHEHGTDADTGAATWRHTYQFDIEGVTHRVVYEVSPGEPDVIPATMEADPV